MSCVCGLGRLVYLADGTETCTHTLDLYKLTNGSLPARWLPLRDTKEGKDE